jgi:transcriptional regulator with XRE-family HTH domain
MGKHKQPRTSGGSLLRSLRENAGRTQFDLELDASLGIGYLQRLELGKVQRPERETLERILLALGVSFTERREVFERFGYTADISPPDESETRRAIEVFRAEAGQGMIPAYLLDCSHRLLDWNTPVTRLFGDIPPTAGTILIPRLIFDPACGIAPSILNAEAFYPAQIRILRYERQRNRDDNRYEALIDDMRGIPLFDRYWVEDERTGPAQILIRPAAHMKLNTRGGAAHFRLIAENLAHDQRFRIIHYLPADPATIRRCLEWQS